MAVQWHYMQNGLEGPAVPSERLRELAAEGAVVPSTPVRRVGSEGVSPWRRAGEIAGLFQGDVASQLGGSICGACARLLTDGRCPHCSPPLPTASLIPPPISFAEHAPVGKTKERPLFSASLTGVIYLLLAFVAALFGVLAHGEDEMMMSEIYGALWFIVAAVLFVGAGITSEVKQMADRIA